MTSSHTSFQIACAAAVVALAAACAATAQTQGPQGPGPQGPAQPVAQAGDAVQRFTDAHGDFARRAVFVPAIQVSGSWMPNAQLGSEPGHFDAWEFDVDATIPLPLDRDSFLIFGLEAGVTDIQFDNVQTVGDETLYRFGPRLGYGKFFTDDLVVQAYWQPSIYSDLGGSLKSEDYKPEYGTALGVYRQSDDLFWKVGFRITDAIDTGVIPVGGVMWHFAPQWMLDVLAPAHAQVRYSADDRWTVSGGLRVMGDEYHVRGPASLGKPSHDVHVQEVLLTLASEYHLTDNLSSQLTVGVTIAGEWDWGYGNGQPKFDGTLDPGLFLEWGLGWRF